MKSSTFLLRNIGQCLTVDSEFKILPHGAIACSEGKVDWVGSNDSIPKEYQKVQEIDAEQRLVTPGLIDCHTHALFAGRRADEFFKRLEGTSYESIAKSGGGILRTMKETRNAKDETLKEGLAQRLDRFLSFGVTTVEIKSGYGLSFDQEIRLLEIINGIEHVVDVVPTFLGAHAIPPEYQGKREEYVNEICEKMLPAVAKQNLAWFCDVFCDSAAFSPAETRKILGVAKKVGLKIKLHADQLSSSGGAEIAAEMGGVSADHLEQISDSGIEALAKSNTVAVLLPGAIFSLGKRSYPPARKLIDSGVSVALSTDCNPGTSFSENLPLMMSLAAVEMKMNAKEIWLGVTRNAVQALSLTDRGSIEVGKRGDLMIWNAEDYREVPYHMGSASAVRATL